MIWADFFKYQHLANKGLVEPLKCPQCDFKLAVRMKPNTNGDVLYLWCSYCDAYSVPGLNLHNQIIKAVRELDGLQNGENPRMVDHPLPEYEE